MDLEEANSIKEKKLALVVPEASADDALVTKSLQLAEDNIVLNRKRAYLENDITRLTLQVTNLQNDLTSAEATCLKKIHDLSQKNKTLINSVEVLTNQVKFGVDSSDYAELKGNFEGLTVKYRDLLHKFGQMGRDRDFQVKMLEEMRKNLQNEKNELENKVVNLCEKLYCCSNGESNEDLEILATKLAKVEASEISERQRANHTNNLYELVKDQLQKSEDRLKQIDKYNTEVLQKNLVLQEQLKDAENKLVSFVDQAAHKSLQSKYNSLLQNNDKLVLSITDLQHELSSLKNSTKVASYHSSQRDQELLSLKHQLVDLQAVSDDKMQIARLSSELSHSRLQEADCTHKMEQLSEELRISNNKNAELTKEMQRKAAEATDRDNELKRKVRLVFFLIECLL